MKIRVFLILAVSLYSAFSFASFNAKEVYNSLKSDSKLIYNSGISLDYEKKSSGLTCYKKKNIQTGQSSYECIITRILYETAPIIYQAMEVDEHELIDNLFTKKMDLLECAKMTANGRPVYYCSIDTSIRLNDTILLDVLDVH